jgi:hypothetical protein
MKYKWLILIVILLSVNAWTKASGGFYPANSAASFQTRSVTVTYAVNRTSHQITMQITQDYVGAGEAFLWLISVPGDSKPVVESNFKPFALPNTPPVFDLPPNYCAGLYIQLYSGGDGGDDPGRGYPQVKDNSILKGAEVVDWLKSRPYAVPDADMNVIQKYAAEGMTFIAAPVSQDEYGNHGSVFLQVEYQSDRVILPLALLQTQAESFEMHINILSDVRYLPENFKDVQLNVNDVRIDDAIRNPLSSAAALLYFTQHSNEKILRERALADVNSQGFFTELAAPTQRLIAAIGNRDSEQAFYFDSGLPDSQSVFDTLSKYLYLTRLYGSVDQTDGQTTLPDAEFVPAPQAPDVSNFIDATHAQPLTVWGCTTRVIENAGYDVLQTDLPTGRTQLNLDYPLPIRYVAHPKGWKLSEVTFQQKLLSIVSPELVDEKVLQSYLDGRPTPPMLLVYSVGDFSPGPCPPYTGLQTGTGANPPKYARCIANLSPAYGASTASMIAVLTSEADFAEHETMYRAMVDFPFTYQYMLHPRLRHSLLLNPINTSENYHPSPASIVMFIPPLAIGYPEGWLEQMPEKQHVLIMPENFSKPENSPYISLYPVQDADKVTIRLQDGYDRTYKDRVADWLVAHFDVNRNSFVDAYQALCELNTPLVYFEHDNRRGYVSYVNRGEQPFLLEISSPDSLYPVYQTEIEAIKESVITSFGCG